MAKKPAPTTTPPPILKVTNFGPIAEAEVELRPLTVFVGPSNTGKTYLATLLYALYRVLYRGFPAYQGNAEDERFGLLSERYSRYFGNADAQFIEKLRSLLSKSKRADAESHINGLEEKVWAFIDKSSPDFQYLIEKELHRCFGVIKTNSLISGTKKSANIELAVPQGEGVGSLVHQFEIKGKKSKHDLKIPSEVLSQKMEAIVRDLQKVNLNPSMDDLSMHLYNASDDFYSNCYESIPRMAHYFPSDRNGVMRIHQVMVSALVQDATTAGLRRSRDIPMLSGILADFLDKLISATYDNRGKSGYGHAWRLEENILKGQIIRRPAEQTNYPAFYYRPEGLENELPLMQASSMVSDIAPIVLYLRHVVDLGDMLIIEEPESSLHPEMQAQLACELARLVNNGYRIVLTTHSEWLLDQFANLVRLSELPEKERKKHHLAEFALDDSQFGAWLFRENKRSKGSVVKELSIDPKKDGLTADYSKLMRDLYNEWADIGNAITEANKK